MAAGTEITDKKEKEIKAAIETVEGFVADRAAGAAAESAVKADNKRIIREKLRASGIDLSDETVEANKFDLYGKQNIASLYKAAKEKVEAGYDKAVTAEAMKKLADEIDPPVTEPPTTPARAPLSDAYITDTDRAKAAEKIKALTYDDVKRARETVARLKESGGKLESITDTDLKDAAVLATKGLTDAEFNAVRIVNTAEIYDSESAHAAGFDAKKLDTTDGTTFAEEVENEIYNSFETAHASDTKKAAESIKTAVLNGGERPEGITDALFSTARTGIEAETATKKTSFKNALQAAIDADLAVGREDVAGSLSALGLGEITGDKVDEVGGRGMVVIAAENADLTLDGVTMEETSNNFTVNGLTLDLLSTTANTSGGYDEVQITVGKDGGSTYDMIKEALTEYNNLIDELNKLYYADSARKYQPLTKEQKEEMTDDEIEKWETKIKDSLLRRDDTLGGLLSGMRTALTSSYTDEDGNEYTLSSFGIVTGNYTERGKLHIYGDAEDSTYATYGDRLKKALEDDPEKVMNALSSIFGNLYSTMSEKCAKTKVSSALTFYNDIQYKDNLKGYEKDLEKMEDKISALEDRYYKQFTEMEKALAKLQSQTNSLASLLGTTTNQQ